MPVVTGYQVVDGKGNPISGVFTYKLDAQEDRIRLMLKYKLFNLDIYPIYEMESMF